MPHRFRSLFQHTQDAVCIADMEGGIVEMNPATFVRFGITPGDVEKSNLRDLFTDGDDWTAVSTSLQAEGQVCRRSVRLRGLQGEPLVAELTCVALREQAGMQLQAIVHTPADTPAAAALDELFDPDTAFAARPERPYTVMHVDRNRFQHVNGAGLRARAV